jgi:hypothetical protein
MANGEVVAILREIHQLVAEIQVGVPSRKGILRTIAAIHHQGNQQFILELTSGVTGRIVELVRVSARCAVRRDLRTVSIDLLQEAGKEFAPDLASERNISH